MFDVAVWTKRGAFIGVPLCVSFLLFFVTFSLSLIMGDALPMFGGNMEAAFVLYDTLDRALTLGDEECEERLVWFLLRQGLLDEAAERVDFLALSRRGLHGNLGKVLEACGLLCNYRGGTYDMVPPSRIPLVRQMLEENSDFLMEHCDAVFPSLLDIQDALIMCIVHAQEGGLGMEEQMAFFCFVLHSAGATLPACLQNDVLVSSFAAPQATLYLRLQATRRALYSFFFEPDAGDIFDEKRSVEEEGGDDAWRTAPVQASQGWPDECEDEEEGGGRTCVPRSEGELDGLMEL